MNNSSVMVKFQKGQFEALKLIFCKIKGQFDLEGQGHQFWNNQRPLDHQYTTQLKFEAEIVQKLLHSQGITQNFEVAI